MEDQIIRRIAKELLRDKLQNDKAFSDAMDITIHVLEPHYVGLDGKPGLYTGYHVLFRRFTDEFQYVSMKSVYIAEHARHF